MHIFKLKLIKTLIFSFTVLASISGGGAQETNRFFNDQHQSAIKWGEINLKTFLDLKNWKDQTAERDLVTDWETIVRERSHREIAGRFFQCVGVCRIDRGQSFFVPNHKTAIYEGDEIQTIGESYAWIFLFDGTMVRLSPESSINLNELNIGVKENFLNARVNAGNVLWLSRNELLYEELNVREKDILFNTLALYEAQPVNEKKPYNEDDLIELVTESQTVLNQYKRLNELIKENNKITKGKRTYAFIVTPNITIMGYKPSVEIVSLLGGKTYFKNRSSSLLGLVKGEVTADDEEILVQMRGFENKELTKAGPDVWFVVDEKGRNLTPATENLYWLAMGEFITKRIPSLLVARELLLTKYSEFSFREKYDPFKLASVDGYRLWGPLKMDTEGKKADLELRLDYLKEYFRRIETTNLLVSTHFSERLKKRNESIKAMEYGNYFFIKALEKYHGYNEFTEYNEINSKGIILNSTKKALWKQMHGIK